MGSQSNVQQLPHLLQCQLTRQNPMYNLTLSEVGNQLGYLEKPLGSINLDELLKNVWTCVETKAKAAFGVVDKVENNNSSANSLQRQASMMLARALGGMTVDQVWQLIQQGQKKRCGDDVNFDEREMLLCEMTLEDFLVQAGLFVEVSLDSSMELETVDAVTPISFPNVIGLSVSPSPSIDTLLDTKPDRKRDTSDAFGNSMERRLKRKINNRESAARSQARKQAYHDELVEKVSRLEEENMRLKKGKEFAKKLTSESTETVYQLRRTSSASF